MDESGHGAIEVEEKKSTAFALGLEGNADNAVPGGSMGSAAANNQGANDERD
jgi:hypothetical protein